MNSTNWPAPNVWVFMAQLVESAAALTQRPWGGIPLKSRNFFGFIFVAVVIAIQAIPITTATKICISAVQIILKKNIVMQTDMYASAELLQGLMAHVTLNVLSCLYNPRTTYTAKIS